MDETSARASAFLQNVFDALRRESPGPRITLTFAQSIDGKIAGVGGEQVAISGKESLVMTHMYVRCVSGKEHHVCD